MQLHQLQYWEGGDSSFTFTYASEYVTIAFLDRDTK